MYDYKGNAIIIEDDESWRGTLFQLLIGYGLSVGAPESYKEAVTTYMNNDEGLWTHKWKIAIIDLRLDEGNDGSMLCHRFADAGIPVIVVTGMPEAAVSDALKDNPVISIKYKNNFSKKEFIELVESRLRPKEKRHKQTLLCISDLHFQPANDSFIKISTPLCQDIRSMMDHNHIQEVDYIVTCGDITHTGALDEYEQALEFFNSLTKELQLKKDRIVLVPGNHDMDWRCSHDSYRFSHKIYLGSTPDGTRVKTLGEDEFLVEIKDQNLRRFDNFNKFYKEVTGRDYPPDICKQIVVQPYHDDNLLFLTMNTCYYMDFFHKDEAAFHKSKAALKIDKKAFEHSFEHAMCEQGDNRYAGYVKIGLSHHPLHISHNDILERLSNSSYAFCLNGHSHNAELSCCSKDNKSGVPLISNGSVGAEWKYRPDGVPLQYNIVEIDQLKQQITIKSRARGSGVSSWGTSYNFQIGKKGGGIKDWVFTFSYS